MKILNHIKKGDVQKLHVMDTMDQKTKSILVHRYMYNGGDIEISINEIEHYEDFSELKSFFSCRFKDIIKPENS